MIVQRGLGTLPQFTAPCLLAARGSLHAALQLLAVSSEGLSSSGSVRSQSTLARASRPVVKGHGGRASVSGVVATVFGATGFVGTYIVQALARIGSQVVIPYRGTDDEVRHLKIMGDLGQVIPIPYTLRNEGLIKAAIAKSNVVINLVGRDFETRNFGFQELNVDAPARLARLAREHGGISSFIHMSCHGASPTSESKQLSTKWHGEQAVLSEFANATIMRPSFVFGMEDRFLNAFARMCKTMPFVPLVEGGKAKVQPVCVLDVASAAMAVVGAGSGAWGKTFELGGPEVLTVHQVAERVLELIREHGNLVSVPLALLKALSLPREWLLNRVFFPLPYKPLGSRDFALAMSTDNVISSNALTLKDLGVTPRPMSGVNVEFLYSYRRGGPNMGSTMGERVVGAGF